MKLRFLDLSVVVALLDNMSKSTEIISYHVIGNVAYVKERATTAAVRSTPEHFTAF